LGGRRVCLGREMLYSIVLFIAAVATTTLASSLCADGISAPGSDGCCATADTKDCPPCHFVKAVLVDGSSSTCDCHGGHGVSIDINPQCGTGCAQYLEARNDIQRVAGTAHGCTFCFGEANWCFADDAELSTCISQFTGGKGTVSDGMVLQCSAGGGTDEDGSSGCESAIAKFNQDCEAGPGLGTFSTDLATAQNFYCDQSTDCGVSAFAATAACGGQSVPNFPSLCGSASEATGLHLKGDHAQLTFGPVGESCTISLHPGPPAKLVSTCEIVPAQD